jgi:FMN reductase
VIEHALRPLFSYLGALTVPTGVYAATADFGGAGAPALARRVERAAGELAALVAGRPGRTVAEPSGAAVVPFDELLAALGQRDPADRGEAGA